jgi:hypothetical protein
VDQRDRRFADHPAQTSELAVNGAVRVRPFARPQIAARWHDVLRG